MEVVQITGLEDLQSQVIARYCYLLAEKGIREEVSYGNDWRFFKGLFDGVSSERGEDAAFEFLGGVIHRAMLGRDGITHTLSEKCHLLAAFDLFSEMTVKSSK